MCSRSLPSLACIAQCSCCRCSTQGQRWRWAVICGTEIASDCGFDVGQEEGEVPLAQNAGRLPICLRTHYAMSGTDIAYDANWNAMPSTDIAYAATGERCPGMP
eukprot:297029-Rhodomonas_salina.3